MERMSKLHSIFQRQNWQIWFVDKKDTEKKVFCLKNYINSIACILFQLYQLKLCSTAVNERQSNSGLKGIFSFLSHINFRNELRPMFLKVLRILAVYGSPLCHFKIFSSSASSRMTTFALQTTMHIKKKKTQQQGIHQQSTKESSWKLPCKTSTYISMGRVQICGHVQLIVIFGVNMTS